MKNEMCPLPYAANELEPAISAGTISYHYGKHLQTYVENVQRFMQEQATGEKELECLCRELPEGAFLNNVGQVLNHTSYFLQLSAQPQPLRPESPLGQAIVRDFGNLDELKKQLTDAAARLFGSGWAWLSSTQDGHLQITQEPNAGNPLRKGNIPLLCIDVWEHAYYLDYQNRRGDYLKSLWNIIDWNVIEKRYHEK